MFLSIQMNTKSDNKKTKIEGLPGIHPEDFPGVTIKVSAWGTLIDRGWFDVRTKTIHLPKGASKSFAQHEYGHYLQSLSFTPEEYKAIERASLGNTVKNFLGRGKLHDTFWTETDANRRSAEFFGPDAPINWKTNGNYNWPR